MVDSRRVRVRIRGRVQGVFFRANARTTGIRLGLRGWVRNCDDGSVEALALGPGAAIEEFIDWCRKGPPAARVDRVEVDPAPADSDAGDGFEVTF